MGLHASNTTELILENVSVPKENLLGEEGNGYKQFLATLDGGRIGIGAMAVGIAQGAYEKALQYAGKENNLVRAFQSFKRSNLNLPIWLCTLN